MEKKKKAAAISIHVVLILVSITMLVPFIWMALTAFKTSTEATSVNPFVIFPAVWQTDNFKTVIDNMNFLQYHPADRGPSRGRGTHGDHGGLCVCTAEF